MANLREQRAVKIDEFLAFLCENLWKPTDLMNTPTRDLTRAQAIQIVIWLLAWGKFTLRNRDELFVVKPDDTITVAGADRKLFVAPSTIEGVEFRYLTEINKKGFKKSIVTPMSNLDPRLVVFLWKLAHNLSRDFNVDTIYHIGFLGKNPNNCHGQGRAVDFAGAAGPDFDLTIAGDWSSQPVTLQNDYFDPKIRRTIARGTVLPDWPPAPSGTSISGWTSASIPTSTRLRNSTRPLTCSGRSTTWPRRNARTRATRRSRPQVSARTARSSCTRTTRSAIPAGSTAVRLTGSTCISRSGRPARNSTRPEPDSGLFPIPYRSVPLIRGRVAPGDGAPGDLGTGELEGTLRTWGPDHEKPGPRKPVLIQLSILSESCSFGF